MRDSRVVQKRIQNKNRYSQYLCFNIIIRSNSLIPEVEYADHQQRDFALIKLFRNGEVGSRMSTQYSNKK